MKKLLLLIFIGSVTFANAQWSSNAVSGSTIYLIKKIRFLDADTGFVTGTTAIVNGNGVIAKTVDGGTSWTTVHTETGKVIYDIFFTSATTGFAVGDSGLLLTTTTGGTSWTESSLTFEALGSVYFPTASIGYISGGYDGTYFDVFKTTDGGAHWSTIPLPSFAEQQPYSIYFTSSTTGFVVGGDIFGGGTGQICYTSNGGTNWDTITTSGAQYYFNAVYFYNSTNGYIAGDGGVILKTTNGGTSWTLANVSVTDDISDITFTSTTTGFASTREGEVLRTTDGGANWTVNANLSSYMPSLNSISFPTSAIGYTGGLFGVYYGKTSNGGGPLGISENEISHSLYIYPNPVINQLTLRISSFRENEVVTVSVVNMLGEVMQAEKVMWSNDASINIKNLSAGIYFVQVANESGRWSGRFVKE